MATMASSTFGIPQLLQAEKRAKEKINEARKGKSRRLKAAKDEAKSEIELFQKHSQESFKEKEQLIMGSKNEMKIRQDEFEQTERSRIFTQSQTNKGVVISRILGLVCNVEPKLHPNYRG